MTLTPNLYQRAVLFGLQRTGRHVYAGTVTPAEKFRRRKSSKAARVARRASRSSK